MKNKRPFEIAGIVIAAILLVLIGFFIFKNQATAPVENEPAISSENNTVNSNTNQIANPASINCEEKGGTLKLMTKSNGGQYGLCEFEENMACEEWALFNNECPEKGVDISNAASEQAKYCLLIGGNLTQSSNTCTLPSGKTCDTQELYNGNCPLN